MGLRNGVTPVLSLKRDQRKIIDLLWNIDIGNGGQRGAPAVKPEPGDDRQCNPMLAAAIMAFQAVLVLKGELKKADGVVDPRGTTLRKLDALAGKPAPAPTPPKPNFIDLKVLRFRQTLGRDLTEAHENSIPMVTFGSMVPFLFWPFSVQSKLKQDMAKGSIHEFLFEIEKGGATFWVGAAVPAGTTDFSRAYVYFHPDTMGEADNATYKTFSGRWETVRRYVWTQGTHMASAKKMALIVPFMTLSSRQDSPSANMFAATARETINDILAAIQISLGRTGKFQEAQQIGVASFSSGVDHLFRFGKKMGSSGILREQMDFDGANIIVKHEVAQSFTGCVNWSVTQNAAHVGAKSAERAGRPGWVYLPAPAWSDVGNLRGHLHEQIGFMTFGPMMLASAIR
ncbi:MAG: hypothetical protein JNK46_04785 [Methylobacteriaceae bacterium]|nr:hypothetical protein [Methylobacteriaceae bacterium]